MQVGCVLHPGRRELEFQRGGILASPGLPTMLRMPLLRTPRSKALLLGEAEVFFTTPA